MRVVVCIFALILVLPAVFATDNAHAEIKPIPRPGKVAAKPVASSHGSAITPLPRPILHTAKLVVHVKRVVVRRTKPAVRTAVRTVRAPVRASARGRSRATPARRVHRARVLARSRGGRYVPPARSHGGRLQPPLPVVPVVPAPTPLAFVASGETLPSYDDPWPSWVLSLLGVMAASEAYLLVHLARARSFA
ncbi:MAG: hypothetical protein QOE87_1145 [Gaiellales bacterium]|nr:hypothetical protein [Gaiellales bacterium]